MMLMFYETNFVCLTKLRKSRNFDIGSIAVASPISINGFQNIVDANPVVWIEFDISSCAQKCPNVRIGQAVETECQLMTTND